MKNFLYKTKEAIEKLLCPRKSMILPPILGASWLARAVATRTCPNGQARRHDENWRQKGDFMGHSSASIASKLCFVLLSISLIICTKAYSENPYPDFVTVAKKAIPSVVSIKVSQNQKQKNLNTFNQFGGADDFNQQFWNRFFNFPLPDNLPQIPSVGQASGFIVSPDGYILTNVHVVHNADDITVFLNDGKQMKAKVIGMDSNTDIALIKIDVKDIPYLTLGDSDNLEVGQWVAAIGTPMGLKATFTQGVVSAKGRNNLDLTVVEDYIQTDASLNRGNSGGPLLNLQAEVVGINTAKGYDGIGFAVPSNIANAVMHQLISNGSVKRGFIGILPQELSEDLATAFGQTHGEGVLVAEVTKNSPAEKGGMKQGDIILQYNNKTVSSPGALRNAIALTAPGSKVPFVISRDGKKQTIQIKIGDRSPEELDSNEHQDNDFGINDFGINDLGIKVGNLTDNLAEKLGYQGEKGVVITQVDPSGLANWAGLRKGALIIAINKTRVESVEQFRNVLDQSEKGEPILLLIKEGKSVRYISLKIN